MPTRIKTRPAKRETEEVEAPAPEAPAREAPAEVHGSELADLAKDWVDEIDDILQENAEEFVRQYQQKGGQ